MSNPDPAPGPSLSTAPSSEPPPAADPTLAQFVETHQKLIAVLGVFTALTLFTSQLRLRIVADFLSFLFLGATIVLWLDLQAQFPRKGSSRKLAIFEDCVGCATLGLLAYSILMYRMIWREGLIMIAWILLSMGARKMIQKWDLFNRVFHTGPGRSRSLRYVVYYTVQMLIFVTSLGLAGLIGIKVNPLLDKARMALEQDSLPLLTSPYDLRVPRARPLPTPDSAQTQTDIDLP